MVARYCKQRPGFPVSAVKMRLLNCVRGCRNIRLNNFTLVVVLTSLIWVNVLIYSLKHVKHNLNYSREIEQIPKVKSFANQKLLAQLKLNQKNKPHNSDDKSAVADSKSKSPSLTKEQMIGLSKHYKLNEFDCAKIFDNVPEVVESAVKHVKNVLRPNRDELSVRQEAYMNMTQNCETFIKSRGYIMSSLTEEEEKFPIAFTIVAYRDTEHMERLLRAIYRPQNFYCIHIDESVRTSLLEAAESIAKCFPNVILPKKRINVSWGDFSVIEPDIICAAELWKFKWKYFINLTGQEFPLKTNYELVKILTAYNGANDIEGTIKRRNTERWAKVSPPPPGLTIVKGSMKVAANRDMVGYMLHNKTGQDLVAWLKSFCDTCIPDEQLFSTLNHNPQLGIRGSYLGEPETDDVIKPFLARYVNWGHDKNIKCADKRFRSVCILSTGDLFYLKNRKELFANKFYLDSRFGDRVALACMEELHYNRTRDEYIGTRKFDTSYYENLGFVKNQLFKPESV